MRSWTVEQGIRFVGGSFVALSVALGVWVNPWWLAFTAFVGLNLVQSAFTGWCPMMSLLKKLGLRSEAGRRAETPFGGAMTRS